MNTALNSSSRDTSLPRRLLQTTLCLSMLFAGELLGQVSVDGSPTGQTIQGSANRTAYTGRRGTALRPTRPIAPPSALATRVADAPANSPAAALPAAYEEVYGGTTEAKTTPAQPLSAAAVPTTTALSFSINPWQQIRYRAQHPPQYSADLYYKRTLPRRSSGGYYGYYGYGGYYGYPFSYYYGSSRGHYYRSHSRSSGTSRTNRYFDGYRYRHESVRVHQPSRQRHSGFTHGH